MKLAKVIWAYQSSLKEASKNNQFNVKMKRIITNILKLSLTHECSIFLYFTLLS